MPVKPLRRPSGLLVVGLGLVLASPVGAQEWAERPPIDLPKYTVTAGRELPPPEEWFYARIEGFEVLSNASAAATRRLLHDFQRFGQALNLLWPGMRPTGTAGVSLIICGRKEKFEEFLPAALQQGERATTSFHVRTREQATLVLDFQTKTLNLVSVENLPGAPAAAAVAPGDLDPAGASAESGPDPGVAVDAFQQLKREYLRYLLAGRPTPPPAWLAEGLAQLCMNMRITETEISVGRVENPNEVSDPGVGRAGARQPAEDRDFNAALARVALLPMAEMFAVASDSATAQNPLNSVWAKQCYAFVHWGLYGDFGRHKKAFASFLARWEREPPSEELFKDCFKIGYAGMQQALRTHIEFTRAQFDGIRPGKGQKIAFPAAPVVRSATEAEVGRLKGDALTLAGHPVAARVILINAYRRGERDPGLLAALGLAELTAGETDRARKFLEAAAAGKAVRPRAHVELARLRLAAAQARPEAADGKLSAAQVAGVLEPLRLARSQPPALAATYELLGAAWSASETAPTAAQLELLREGLRLFPQEPALRARFEKLTVGFTGEK